MNHFIKLLSSHKKSVQDKICREIFSLKQVPNLRNEDYEQLFHLISSLNDQCRLAAFRILSSAGDKSYIPKIYKVLREDDNDEHSIKLLGQS